jgi:hypothetical protein
MSMFASREDYEKARKEAKMETKHTLGPWRVAYQGNHEMQITFICLVIGDEVFNLGPSGQRLMANARLMAAAPELLVELRHAAALIAAIADRMRTIDVDGERLDLLAVAELFDSVTAKAIGTSK